MRIGSLADRFSNRVLLTSSPLLRRPDYEAISVPSSLTASASQLVGSAASGSTGLPWQRFLDVSRRMPNHYRKHDDDVFRRRWIVVDLHLRTRYQLRVDCGQQRRVPHRHSGRVRGGRRHRPVFSCTEHWTATHRNVDDHRDSDHHHAERALESAIQDHRDALPRGTAADVRGQEGEISRRSDGPAPRIYSDGESAMDRRRALRERPAHEA